VKSPHDIPVLSTHYIDGRFVESHGREVMELVRPTDRKLIGRVALGDVEDTRHAIAAASRAFASYRTQARKNG
jgi:aldehyde dehydrogenase (NAD+)